MDHDIAEEVVRQVAIKERLLYWLLRLCRETSHPDATRVLVELGYAPFGERAERLMGLGEPARHIEPERIDHVLSTLVRIDPVAPNPLRLHGRYRQTEQAKLALSDAVLEWLDKHPRMTFAEIVYCLNAQLTTWSGLMVREERYQEQEED